MWWVRVCVCVSVFVCVMWWLVVVLKVRAVAGVDYLELGRRSRS